MRRREFIRGMKVPEEIFTLVLILLSSIESEAVRFDAECPLLAQSRHP
jgi:hypothetical protein